MTTIHSTQWGHRNKRIWQVKNVIFSASSLGTQELLLRLKDNKTLPNISKQLGTQVRTNAESILGVRFFEKEIDMSQGVAIGSSIYLDHNTHIEATRYQRGSDGMGLLTTHLVGGKPGFSRILLWLWALIFFHHRQSSFFQKKFSDCCPET